MRITTWNVNGLRSALDKGFERFVKKVDPDALLLQEIRTWPEQLEAKHANPRSWHVAWHPAEKKGYAGTAIWSRAPLSVHGVGMDDADPDGRVLTCRAGDVWLVSAYLPSGSSGDEAQARKEAWMDRFLPWATALAKRPEPVILGGDLNIAHTENDIHNPGGNKKNSGFLPHERTWFGELLDRGWTDAVRHTEGDVKGPYSWWSNRGRARELNRGWRLDYLLLNPAAAERLVATETLREGGMKASDHCPVTVELDL